MTEEVATFADYGDHWVTQFCWTNDQKDLVIELTPNGKNPEPVLLCFVGAHELIVDWFFGTYAGAPFLYESRCTQSDDGRFWEVALISKSTPEGYLKLKCSEIYQLFDDED